MFGLRQICTTVLKLGVGAILFILSTHIASATITLFFDSTSSSSNTPATGASAKAEFLFSDDGSGGVKIDLLFTNTTGAIPVFGSGATESKLTGIGFDLIRLNTGITTFVSGTHLNTLILTPTLPPFESFDIGIADNANFLGGNANAALPQGSTDTASFILIGSGLTAAVLEDEFFDGFSTGSLGYVARFQQVNGSGADSDKLLGGTATCDSCGFVPPPPPPVAIAEPATLALFGLGLLGIGVVRQARLKAGYLVR
ncbi:PEP-CTERM protein-sorting domain-containing protein [Nitrosomonas cryotolerans]|uniref:PEP-CTERM protein-sorting domain-containing protein n=1 Tax=Nitrosomonas cryotolerans ATCC 49181 TaxID=1131553 RepID=A0A1N6FUU1_9PROT|nr:PEP-CTERM sorting domain-containing protein [Nitrosomonas cryotolerans]SFP76528.1 PEP-CTERM protein-sorting domain-containing protein [Nitrosomonas cryotolerans]SIN98987.1 PEP-CTERM protein-sorting domain-containing protein [Nitrosomonas cryotolerans ATCC 49181]